MALLIVESENVELEDAPLFESSGLIDDMKLEHLIKVIDKYSLQEIETLLPEYK